MTSRYADQSLDLGEVEDQPLVSHGPMLERAPDIQAQGG
jgi:hypothetical protein